MKDQREGIAPLHRINLRHDHRNKRRMRVREVAHVRVIDITPDEPAHGAPGDDI